MESYLELLERSARRNHSILSLGLDPLPESYPFQKLPPAERISATYERLFDRMIGAGLIPGAFKPNLGYYHRLDRPLEGSFDGSKALARVIGMLRQAFPGTPLILDAKRGDIATSSANYAEEAFKAWQADAVTVAPYMGSDSVEPFLSWCGQGKGVYVLNRTSNPGGREFQNLEAVDGVAGKGSPFYLEVAALIASWAERAPGTGAVVGATNPEELARLAQFQASRRVPFLIPGVGGQGGSGKLTIYTLKAAGYPVSLARINSSSGITHPWAKEKRSAPSNWDQLSIDALMKLEEDISYGGE